MNRYVIVVAGGSGIRMGTDIPKQFLNISGKPVLMYTLEAFTGFSPGIKIILVLPSAHLSLWNQLCSQHHFNIPFLIAEGGETRGDSVRNGLGKINDQEAIVAIHDGVRPCIDAVSIQKAFELAEKFGSAVPAMEITDSVRIIEDGVNRPFDRKVLRSIQTPQCFNISILRRAYSTMNFRQFTDDAGLVGNLGISIKLFEGNPENIKITSPFDLLIAEAIIQNRSVNYH